MIKLIEVGVGLTKLKMSLSRVLFLCHLPPAKETDHIYIGIRYYAVLEYPLTTLQSLTNT